MEPCRDACVYFERDRTIKWLYRKKVRRLRAGKGVLRVVVDRAKCSAEHLAEYSAEYSAELLGEKIKHFSYF